MTEPQHRAAQPQRRTADGAPVAPEPTTQLTPPIPGLAVRRKMGADAIQAPFTRQGVRAVRAHTGGAGAGAAQALGAHAYAHGSEIHIGGDTAAALPHEAWHVVQQSEGPVLPSVAMQDEAARDGHPGPDADVQR